MSRMRKTWTGFFASSVLLATLAASCSGAEFGSEGLAGSPAASAGAATDSGGAPTEPGGGAPASGGTGTGAHAGDAGDLGGAAGEASLPEQCALDAAPTCASRTEVASCDESGKWQTYECESGPQDCVPATCRLGRCVSSKLRPADTKGDCKQWQCVDGEASEVPALDDLPAPRGACDVVSCTEAGPTFTPDDGSCALNQRCDAGNCTCRACPNGKLMAAIADTCIMPQGVAATASQSNAMSLASSAVDGDATTTWNSGAKMGTLTLVLDGAQAMTALVVYVTGSAGGGLGAKTILLTASVETRGSMTPLVKTGKWDFSATPTGPIRLELGLVEVTKVTLSFSSATSWIAVNEALFVLCT